MKILKILLIVVATLFVCGGSCIGYVGYRAQRAKHLVDEFCKSVTVGQSSSGLATRARASGLDVTEFPEHPSAAGSPGQWTLLCSQGVFLARHTCQIGVSASEVVKVERGFVD